MIPHTNGMSKAMCPECKFENWYDTSAMKHLYKKLSKTRWDEWPIKIECGNCGKCTVKVNNQSEYELHKIGEGIEREALA